MATADRRRTAPVIRTVGAFLLGLVAGILVMSGGRRDHDGPAAAAFVAHSGVNLPWLRYGWDIGANPWDGDPRGFQFSRERLDADFAFLREHRVSVCRVFLFCDFRTGLVRTEGGDIAGLDPYVDGDIRALLDSAQRHGLRLIPVLLDHTVANGVSDEDGIPVGEHPDLIADPERREQFMARVLAPIMREYGAHPAVWAWEIMNEPRFATAVEPADIRAFMHAAAVVIRAHAPGKPVTIGHYDRHHHAEYGGAAANLVQVHYYHHMADYWRFDTPAAALSSRPVVFGEVEPVAVRRTLDTALRNGYAGVLFWSLNADDGYDFRAVASAYASWARRAARGGGCRCCAW